MMIAIFFACNSKSFGQQTTPVPKDDACEQAITVSPIRSDAVQPIAVGGLESVGRPLGEFGWVMHVVNKSKSPAQVDFSKATFIDQAGRIHKLIASDGCPPLSMETLEPGKETWSRLAVGSPGSKMVYDDISVVGGRIHIPAETDGSPIVISNNLISEYEFFCSLTGDSEPAECFHRMTECLNFVLSEPDDPRQPLCKRSVVAFCAIANDRTHAVCSATPERCEQTRQKLQTQGMQFEPCHVEKRFPPTL